MAIKSKDINMHLSEEGKIINEEIKGNKLIKAYKNIPYSLINSEAEKASDIVAEFEEITQFYKVYKEGKSFFTEGTNGDYVPSNLRYKIASSLIKKEARFMFAESPTIVINPKGDLQEIDEESKKKITVLNDLIKTVLERNHFEDSLLKAARDCFVGKRIAILVNFNEESGITLSFLPSRQFIYEMDENDPSRVKKFVCFMIVRNSKDSKFKRIFKKKFEIKDNVVYLSEAIYDGSGKLVKELIVDEKLSIDFVPVKVIVNDGMLGDLEGVSEIEDLEEEEKWFSKLNNSDIDTLRKGMNPVKYAIDMESNSTKNLSTSPGSFWDLQSDQNLDKSTPNVGMLEHSMTYNSALKETLERIKTNAYEQVDVPNINLETMSGTITSGKALKAIYWPLIVRCKEKMKVWKPQLQGVIDIIIQGALVYPNCAKGYVTDIISDISYEIDIKQNIPIPEDEVEEKNMDLAEVLNKTMSRKTYMKKWRGLSDNEADDEIRQIAEERQLLDDIAFDMGLGGSDSDSGEGEDDIDSLFEDDEDDFNNSLN